MYFTFPLLINVFSFLCDEKITCGITKLTNSSTVILSIAMHVNAVYSLNVLSIKIKQIIKMIII